jgi:hypothetical protein
MSTKQKDTSKKDCKIKAADFDTLPPPRRKNLTMEEKRSLGRVKRKAKGATADYQARRSDLVTEAGKRVSKSSPLIVRHVNRRIKENFKMACAKHGTHMNAAILDFIRWFGNSVVEAGDRVGRVDTFYGRAMDGKGSYRAAFVPKVPNRFMQEKTAKE